MKEKSYGKSVVKRISGLLFVMVLLFSFTLVGCKAKASPYDGKWYSVASGMGSLMAPVSEEDEKIIVEITGVGKGKFSVGTTSANIKWTEEGDKITMEVEGEKLPVTIDGDYMYIEDLKGMQVILGREGTDAQDPKNYLMEEEKPVVGKWASVKMFDILDAELTELEGKTPEEALVLDFKNNHTVDMTLLNEETKTYTWSVSIGSIFIETENADEPIIFDVPVGDEMNAQIQYNDTYYTFQCVRQ